MKSELQLLEECIETRQKRLIELRLKQASISQSMDVRPVSSFSGQYGTLAEVQIQIAQLLAELEILQHEHIKKGRDITEKEVIIGTKEQVLNALAQNQGDDIVYRLIEVRKANANV